MSSARRRLAAPLLLGVATVGLLAVVHARHEWPPRAEAATTRPPELNPAQEAWYRAALGVPGAGVATVAVNPFGESLVRWKRLMRDEGQSFDDYASFLEAHRGWPGEQAMRRAAERAIDPDATPPDAVVRYFAAMPPTTNTGQARYALALAAVGQVQAARATAGVAWTGGMLSAADEARLASRFAFTATEQDQRAEKLLWQRAAADRQIALASPARRSIYAARAAFQRNAADAQALGDAAGPSATRDPGFLLDQARWLAASGRAPAARGLLAAATRLDATPYDAQAWLTGLLDLATATQKAGDPVSAAAIARLGRLTYPAGIAARDRPLAERDPYTSLMWTGGQAALAAARPADAVGFFEAYATGAKSPSTQSKGLYWAGRAALAAADPTRAAGFFGRGAAYYDQFYGQLAAERVGRALPVPPTTPPVTVTPQRRAAFDADERVHAARLLGELGDWTDQSLFVRQIAGSAADDVDHLLIARLAGELDRPDLGVMVARAGRQSGLSDYVLTGWPEVAVPPTAETSWTMIHAISRQESQFDRMATSRVGARGLMQLMPATAREQAGMLGLPFDTARLTDPGYNVQLGSAFFARLMDRYGGNAVLAVAAYNAGPGNVNKFIRANGDPRAPGADVVAWIEAIPLSETRGYVQHVLENAVVYDLLNPDRARMPAANRLSAYLGKSQPG